MGTAIYEIVDGVGIIHKGVRKIGPGELDSSLTSIVIPKGVTDIGKYAFEGCVASYNSLEELVNNGWELD